MNKDKKDAHLQIVRKKYYEMTRIAIDKLVETNQPFDHHKVVDLINEQEVRLIKNN